MIKLSHVLQQIDILESMQNEKSAMNYSYAEDKVEGRAEGLSESEIDSID